MILKKKLLLYETRGTSPTPPPSPVFSYLEIDGTKSYTLDYQITTGYEMAIADIEYNQTWSFYSNKHGWSKMIGIHDSDLSSKKWFLGAYRGGSLNPGTQFGSNGDRTLSVGIATTYNDSYYNKIIINYSAFSFYKFSNRISTSKLKSSQPTSSQRTLVSRNVIITKLTKQIPKSSTM